jgi:gamma-glutamyltranspeptidase/glutathione hydrolase
MVVTANPYASQAAAQILRKGGHAVDAAIAAQLVLNLVEPQSSGLGGGGFMLVWDQAQQSLKAYDGRETAPAAGQVQDFLDSKGDPLPFHDIVRSGKAVGVPGLPALLGLVHARHSRLDWATLLQPAIDLADKGFFVSPRLQALLENDRLLRDDPHAAELFYPDDKALKAGLFIRNPAFAHTLKSLAQTGITAFYKGDMPRQIIRNISQKTGNRPSLSEADFAQYQAIERAALCAPVRQAKVCGMPPPSAGGIAVLQMLQMLELQLGDGTAPLLKPQAQGINWDASRLGPWLRATRLAYEDRTRFVADPDRVEVNAQRLISKSWLKMRLTEFSLTQSQADDTRPSTTHLSIVDAVGNAVALTSSIEDQFGSRIMVNGFLLNNQLTDFDFKMGSGGSPSPNAFEGGKRPRSSMSPTLILSNAEPARVLGVVGSPGGSQIPSFIASRLMAHWWGRHPIEQAVAAGHVTLRENRIDAEVGYASPDWINQLKNTLPASLGRDELPVNVAPQTSGIHWIVRDGDAWVGVADPRREGQAIGQ